MHKKLVRTIVKVIYLDRVNGKEEEEALKHNESSAIPPPLRTIGNSYTISLFVPQV